MKTTIKYLMILFALVIVSCSEDEEPQIIGSVDAIANWRDTVLLMDANRVTDFRIHAVDKSIQIPFNGIAPRGLSDLAKPRDLSNLVLIALVVDGGYFAPFTVPEAIALSQAEVKCGDIMQIDTVQKSITKWQKDEHHGIRIVEFYTAFVTGKVTITADKTLFGIPAGESLNKHFTVRSTYLGQGFPKGRDITSMAIEFGDTTPKNVDEFFVEDLWLSSEYAFTIIGAPEEQYDEITFHIEIPNDGYNYHSYYKSIYFMNYEPETYYQKERIFRQDCTVRF